MVQIAPSMLAADFLHLEKDVEMVNEYADLFHLDIMDGVFVPNLSYGFPVVEAIASIAKKPLDVHLMIVNPENYVKRFAQVGAGMISFHLNATENPDAVLASIRESGAKAGLVINPDIPVESLFPHLKNCDYILLMSVFAGFGGQKFIEDTYQRVRTLKAEIERQGLVIPIEVDGGVSASNAAALVEAGAEMLVAGSAVFSIVLCYSMKNAILTLFFFALMYLMVCGIVNVTTSLIPFSIRKYGNVGSISALLDACCYAGAVCSTYAFGAIADNSGWKAALQIAALIAVVSAVVVLVGSLLAKRTALTKEIL